MLKFTITLEDVDAEDCQNRFWQWWQFGTATEGRCLITEYNIEISQEHSGARKINNKTTPQKLQKNGQMYQMSRRSFSNKNVGFKMLFVIVALLEL